MCAPMTHTALQKVRNSLAGMEAVLAESQGGRSDDDALLEFRRMCWSALLLLDDSECQGQIDQLVQHAKDLYSDREQQRAEILRDKIRAALGTLRLRLQELERGYGKRWRDLRAA